MNITNDQQDNDTPTNKNFFNYNLGQEGIAQFGTLLTLLKTLENYIIPVQPNDAVGMKEPIQIDGEISAAAQVTFIKTCDRLENLMAEETRWKDPLKHPALVAAESAHAAQKKFLEAETDLRKILARPSIILRPAIYRTHTGQFIAGYGNPQKPESFLCGIGETPEAAFFDFDKVFRSKDELIQKVIVAANEAIPEEPGQTEQEAQSPGATPEKPKRRPKKAASE